MGKAIAKASWSMELTCASRAYMNFFIPYCLTPKLGLLFELRGSKLS